MQYFSKYLGRMMYVMLNTEIHDDLEVRELKENISADSIAESKIDDAWQEKTNQYIQRCISSLNINVFGIFYHSQLLGVVAVESKDEHLACIHFELIPDERGKGIMTRGIFAVISRVYERLPVTRFEIRPNVLNKKACAIPQKLGFTQERPYLREDYRGKREIAIYSMTKDAWKKRKKTKSITMRWSERRSAAVEL